MSSVVFFKRQSSAIYDETYPKIAPVRPSVNAYYSDFIFGPKVCCPRLHIEFLYQPKNLLCLQS